MAVNRNSKVPRATIESERTSRSYGLSWDAPFLVAAAVTFVVAVLVSLLLASETHTGLRNWRGSLAAGVSLSVLFLFANLCAFWIAFTRHSMPSRTLTGIVAAFILALVLDGTSNEMTRRFELSLGLMATQFLFSLAVLLVLEWNGVVFRRAPALPPSRVDRRPFWMKNRAWACLTMAAVFLGYFTAYTFILTLFAPFFRWVYMITIATSMLAVVTLSSISTTRQFALVAALFGAAILIVRDYTAAFDGGTLAVLLFTVSSVTYSTFASLKQLGFVIDSPEHSHEAPTPSSPFDPQAG